MKVLIDLQKDTSVNPLARPKAKKLEKDLQYFNKVFSFVLLYEILTLFEDLSHHLQSIDLTAELACFCINKVREQVKQVRGNVEFQKIYEKVEKMGLACDTTTKSRKVRKCYDDSEVLEELHTTQIASRFSFTSKAEIKHQYIDVIDKITASGEGRFSQEDISFMQTIKALLTSSINGKTLEDQGVLIREVTN